MRATTIRSSNIQNVAYDQEERELYVQFATGSWYAYQNVDEKDYVGLMTADSCGRFLNEHIKPNCPFRLIDPVDYGIHV